MNLYTFILEFEGGTYVNQNKANDEFEALDSWTGDIARNSSVLNAHNPEDIDALIKKMADEQNTIVALKESKNVWFCSCLVNDELALLHIIKTESE